MTYKGREAITLALQSLALPAGSTVAVNGYTCYAVHQAVTAAGLEPLYLDIETDQLNFTAERLTQAIKNHPEIGAVMIQNTLGLPADVAAITALCSRHKLPLIEDLAHSIGLKYADGREAGTVGVASVLSFSQDKMIDAVTGGAVVFNAGAAPAVTLSTAGLKHRFTTRVYPWATIVIRSTIRIQIGRGLLKAMKMLRLLPGPMSGAAAPAHQLPAWQSQVALRAYPQLSELIKHRQNIAAVYQKWLPSSIQFRADTNAVWLRFPIQVEAPLELITYLRRFGFYLSDRWYDAPVSPQKSLLLTTYKIGQCPNAEALSKRMLNLPTHLHINEAQARQLTEHINQWLEARK